MLSFLVKFIYFFLILCYNEKRFQKKEIFYETAKFNKK